VRREEEMKEAGLRQIRSWEGQLKDKTRLRRDCKRGYWSTRKKGPIAGRTRLGVRNTRAVERKIGREKTSVGVTRTVNRGKIAREKKIVIS